MEKRNEVVVVLFQALFQQLPAGAGEKCKVLSQES
jgi:hypothetical protein